MRRLAVLLLLPLAACNKSAPTADSAGTDQAGVAVKQPDPALVQLANDLKSTSQDKRSKALVSVPTLDDEGEDVVPVLLEALKIPTCGRLGTSSPERPDSTRETAVQALLSLKEKGKIALRDHGVRSLEAGLKDAKPEVREHTACALGMIGPDAKPAADSLLKLCVDREKEVRASAYRSLERIKQVPPGPILQLLMHPNPLIAIEAAGALLWLKPKGPDVIAPLLAAVQRKVREKDEPSDIRYVRNQSAQALATAGADAAVAVPPLVDMLVKADKDDVESMIRPAQPNERAANMSGPILALRRLGKPSADAVAALLVNREPLIRFQAAAVLSGMKKADAVDALPKIVEALEAERDLPAGQMYVFEELAAAALNLGADTEKVAPRVVALLKEDEEGVRYRACKLCVRLGPKAAPGVPQLIELLTDKVSQVRFAAVEALGAIGPAAKKAVPELAKTVAAKDVNLGRAAAKALRGFGPDAQAATPALATALDSVDQSFCIDAADTLAAIGPGAVEAIPAITKHLGDDAPRREESVALLNAAAAVGPAGRAATPAVIKLVGSKDQAVRVVAVETLGKIAAGDTAATTRLVELLKDTRNTQPMVMVAALKSLAAMKATSATVDVKGVRDATKDPATKVWAAAALVAFGSDADANRATVVAAIKDEAPAAKGARVAAIDAAEVVGKPAIAALLDALKDKTPVSRSDGEQVRERAARTLGRLAATEAVGPLTTALSDPWKGIRRQSAESLGLIGPPAIAAAGKLRELTRTDPDIAATAQKAVDRIEPPMAK